MKYLGWIVIAVMVLRQMLRTMILDKEYDNFVYITFVGFVYSLMALGGI